MTEVEDRRRIRRHFGKYRHCNKILHHPDVPGLIDTSHGSDEPSTDSNYEVYDDFNLYDEVNTEECSEMSEICPRRVVTDSSLDDYAVEW